MIDKSSHCDIFLIFANVQFYKTHSMERCKYHYYKLLHEKPWNNIFFNWKVFLCLMLLFIIGFFIFNTDSLSLNFPTVESQIKILNSVLVIIGLFVSIVFSFLILSFNVSHRYYGRYAISNFLKNRKAKASITFLISSIILLIYSLYYLGEATNADGYTNFLFISSIVLSIVSFFFIFPAFNDVLENSHSRSKIDSIFGLINEDRILDEIYAEEENNISSYYHKDPINIIYEIGITSIKDYDYTSLEIITSKIPLFFKQNIQNKEENKFSLDYRRLYFKLTTLLSDIYDCAIKEKNEKYSFSIIRSLFSLEYLILENIHKEDFSQFLNFSKYNYLNFSINLEKLFNKAIKHDEEGVCEYIIDLYNSFSKKSILDIAPKNISYSKTLHYSLTEKYDIVIEPLRQMKKYSEMLLANRKAHLLKEVFNVIYVLECAVMELQTSNGIKCMLYNIILNYKKDIFINYISKDEVASIKYLYFPFKQTVHIYKNTKCKIPFLGLLDILDELFNKNKLNNLVLNEVKAEMLHIIRDKIFSDDLMRRAIEKFVSIGSKVTKNDPDNKKDTYMNLQENLCIVLESAIEEKVDGKWINILKQSIDGFKLYKKFEIDLSKKGYIRDRRII